MLVVPCAAAFNTFDCKLPTAVHKTANVTAITASKMARIREKKRYYGRTKVKTITATAQRIEVMSRPAATVTRRFQGMTASQ